MIKLRQERHISDKPMMSLLTELDIFMGLFSTKISPLTGLIKRVKISRFKRELHAQSIASPVDFPMFAWKSFWH
jgi:hypothetical protein